MRACCPLRTCIVSYSPRALWLGPAAAQQPEVGEAVIPILPLVFSAQGITFTRYIKLAFSYFVCDDFVPVLRRITYHPALPYRFGTGAGVRLGLTSLRVVPTRYVRRRVLATQLYALETYRYPAVYCSMYPQRGT